MFLEYSFGTDESSLRRVTANRIHSCKRAISSSSSSSSGRRREGWETYENRVAEVSERVLIDTVQTLWISNASLWICFQVFEKNERSTVVSFRLRSRPERILTTVYVGLAFRTPYRKNRRRHTFATRKRYYIIRCGIADSISSKPARLARAISRNSTIIVGRTSSAAERKSVRIDV